MRTGTPGQLQGWQQDWERKALGDLAAAAL